MRKLFSESHKDPARFERGMLFAWIALTLAGALWFLIYALEEFRPAM